MDRDGELPVKTLGTNPATETSGQAAEVIRIDDWLDKKNHQPGDTQLIEENRSDPKQIIEEAVEVDDTGKQKPTPLRLTRVDITRALCIRPSATKKMTDEIMDEYPELFELGVTEQDMDVVYCKPKVLHLISAKLPAPKNWTSDVAFARLTGFDIVEVRQVLKRFRSERPLDIRPHINGNDDVLDHISPDVASNISQYLRKRDERQRTKDRLRNLEEDFQEFAEEMKAGLSLEADEFQKLIGLFGAESAADLLFHYKPEYAKVPVESIKSFLADYLGDFVVTRGIPTSDYIEMAVEFLSEPKLREALTEVIKRDCLAKYHSKKRDDPGRDDFEVVSKYLHKLRIQTGDLDNENLLQVLDDVETYYLSLLIDFDLPANMVENLQSDRPFPDLNQRINIKDICEKRRMLIGDDAGLGKSASSIIAKEQLGAKLAVIVAPKSVMNKGVWQDYLSDNSDLDSAGRRKGYFREGQAPRVLEVDGPASLRDINPSDWDYIIISHETLTPAYTQTLKKIGFDMLIVDEAHKLNNISSGVRANQLVELSDHLAGRRNTYTVIQTATPAPNKVSDIAMSLRILYPNKLAQYTNKELAYLMIRGSSNGNRGIFDLRSLLVPRLQMKSLEDCIDIPKLQEITEYIELSEREQQLYDVLVDDDEEDFNSKMQACRKVLLNPATLEVVPPIIPTKAIKVNEQLNTTFQDKQKVLLFVNDFVTEVIRGNSSIVDFFDLPKDVAIRVLHGDDDMSKRAKVQEEFQVSEEKMLLVVSGKIADVGIDLSAADELIFYNEGWTMAEKRQEIGRAQRPGRTSPLLVRTYIADNTIEVGIHDYIHRKDQAIRKLLFGIPLTELEKDRLMKAEDEKVEENLDVNPELAAHYFTAQQKIERKFGRDKEQGEKAFYKKLPKDGEEYASIYRESLISRSYQANMARLTSAIIDSSIDAGEIVSAPLILDLGSGPEMLKRHMPDNLVANIVSLDINKNHFAERAGNQNLVGSVVTVPVANKSVDVVSLGLVLDTTKYRPTKRAGDDEALERLEIFKEINRVLKPGGRAVITQIYSLDLADPKEFKILAEQMGFKLVEEYSGLVYSQKDPRGRVITLEKVHDCAEDMDALVQEIGSKNLSGLKFIKRDSKVRNPKKIDRTYTLDNGNQIVPIFNAHDKVVAQEEHEILSIMIAQRDKYRRISNIPAEVIVAGGLSRIKIKNEGKTAGKYTLFKQLGSAAGAVFLKD